MTPTYSALVKVPYTFEIVHKPHWYQHKACLGIPGPKYSHCTLALAQQLRAIHLFLSQIQEGRIPLAGLVSEVCGVQPKKFVVLHLELRDHDLCVLWMHPRRLI